MRYPILRSNSRLSFAFQVYTRPGQCDIVSSCLVQIARGIRGITWLSTPNPVPTTGTLAQSCTAGFSAFRYPQVDRQGERNCRGRICTHPNIPYGTTTTGSLSPVPSREPAVGCRAHRR